MQTEKEFEEFLEKLKKASKEKIIIVEGIKDKKALESLKIKNIITLKKPLYKIIEYIVESKKECIILTDLDKKGKELYSKLSSKLKHFGVNIDNRFRDFLFKTKLRQIEGITTYLKTIQKQ
ncbi:toprim domain-containing protein [Candidatus Woesearchaeota archaeon]|nr:toprim domain-containing protein [Candidatus Woesearchaeota archaeon]